MIQLRALRIVSIWVVCIVGAGGLFDSHATEVFLEATRSNFQKISLGVVGIHNIGDVDWVGGRIEEVLKKDLQRSLVFELMEVSSIGRRVQELGSGIDDGAKNLLRHVAEQGVSVVVWGKAGLKGLDKDGDIKMEGFVYDSGSGEVLGGKRYIGSSPAVREIAHRFSDELVYQYTGEQGIARTKIAYIGERGTAREVFVMDYDGQGPRQLTADGFLNLMPRWSPDRRFLVFTTHRTRTTQHIDMLEVATGKRWTLVALGGMNITPALSPDGHMLAFASNYEGDFELYRLDMKTKVVERLTSNRAGDLSPSWSPTGRELVFVSDRGGGPQLFLVSADGSNVRRLTFDGDYNAAPVWSPRGDWIAYVCRRHQEYKLCIISPDGEKGMQVTTGVGLDDAPSWSPDGRHLTFSSTVDGQSHIYMVNANGKDRERLTFEGANNSAPSWSPIP